MWLVASLGNFGKQDEHSERDCHRWLKSLYGSNLEKYHLKLEVILSGGLGKFLRCNKHFRHKPWSARQFMCGHHTLIVQSAPIVCEPPQSSNHTTYHLTLVIFPNEVESREVDVPCLIPFETFHSIHEQGPELFRNSLLGEFGAAGVRCFWGHAKQEAWAKEHKTLQEIQNYEEVGVPLTWHMDGCEMQRNSEFYILNCGSILAQASETHSLDARFVVCGIPHLIMKLPGIKKKVMRLFGRFAAWNHAVMKTGIMPFRGFYNEEFPTNSIRYKNRGQKIMGDFIGIYVGCKSDGKARVPWVRF